MKEFLLLPAVGGIFIFMYEMLKKFDAFCDANRQNLWLEEDAVPEEKEESAEQVMDDCLSSSVSAERNGRLEKLLAAFQREKKVQNFRDLFTSILILLAASVMGYFFNSLGFANANIMTVFVFAVQLIAVLTNHRAYSMIAAVLSETAIYISCLRRGIPGYLSDHVRYCIFDRNAGTEVKKSGKTVRNGGFPHKDFV